jgi:hypothetical protein
MSMPIVASIVVAASLLAVQTPSASARQKWTFYSEMVEGRPVLQVVHVTEEGERVTHQIAPDDLPIEDRDCELECRLSPAMRGCYGKCLRGALYLLLFDEPRLTAFIAADTGSGQNFARVILKLNVRSGELTRVGRTFGAGFDDVQLSADGRYLAYRMAQNAGGMEGGWNLNVMDTQTGDEQEPVERMYRAEDQRGNDVIVDVRNYKWSDASTISFTAITRPRKKAPEAATPRGNTAQYVYSVVDRRLMTARDQRLIP